MKFTATIEGDPYGKVSFSLDRDVNPSADATTMRACAAAAELLRIRIGRAIGHMRDGAHSAGMGADFDEGIRFAHSVGDGGEEAWRSVIRGLRCKRNGKRWRGRGRGGRPAEL
jgi:hypothetical protein